jgi:hypothetical protein
MSVTLTIIKLSRTTIPQMVQLTPLVLRIHENYGCLCGKTAVVVKTP